MLKYSPLILLLLFVVSCKKESVTPDPATPPVVTPTNAVFSVRDGSNNCFNITLGGSYFYGVPLTSANTATLHVNVTTVGLYALSTETINGYKFSASGTFTATGEQDIVLLGSGMPGNASVDSFTVVTPSATCGFSVIVLDPSLNDNDNMYFGNISRAAALTDSANNYLMRKPYYSLSYSKGRSTPNWVSWHLFANDIGSINRSDDFREDVTLPAGWYKVTTADYNGSGFDRGHNTPSGDRTSTTEANSSTFLMTNMIPQAPNNNQIVWARMEDSLRRLTTLGYEVYIVMGSYGTGGTGANGLENTIAGVITVPSHVWKVAVAIPNGDNDSSRVTVATRVIAVDVPNINTLNGNWKTYRVSVDAIEAATGYNILTRLPEALQAQLEARVDNL